MNKLIYDDVNIKVFKLDNGYLIDTGKDSKIENIYCNSIAELSNELVGWLDNYTIHRIKREDYYMSKYFDDKNTKFVL